MSTLARTAQNLDMRNLQPWGVIPRALPEEKLAKSWDGVRAQAGALLEIGRPRVMQSGGTTVLAVPLRCQHLTVDIVVSSRTGEWPVSSSGPG